MMETNYPQMAKIWECQRLIKKHGIEDQDLNGNEIMLKGYVHCVTQHGYLNLKLKHRACFEKEKGDSIKNRLKFPKVPKTGFPAFRQAGNPACC
jgi:hypothetical protein